jgi:hypothetical protein
MEIVGFGLRRICPVELLKSFPFLALLAVTSLFVGLLGFCWLRQPPSNQELLANYAKVADYVNAATSVRGIPWWTPNFLQGCSLAFLSLGRSPVSSLRIHTILDPYAGVKIATLALLFACLTMFAFIRRLCPGSMGGIFLREHCCSHQLLLRLGHLEHVANVLAFLSGHFLGRSRFLEEGQRIRPLLCTASGAASPFLRGIAVLVLPLLVLFAVWAWLARVRSFQPSWRMVCFAQEFSCF